jgi:L-fuconolactonase
VLAGLAAVGASGPCYDLVVRADQLPAAIDAAQACPGLVFVLDHLGNPSVGPRPGELWMTVIRRLAALPNTVCKLSGVLGEQGPDGEQAGGGSAVARLVPYFDVVVGAFGPERIMFGSDWPVCTLSASYGQVVAAARALTSGLSAIERAAVFGGTARRIYRLGQRASLVGGDVR